MYYIVEVVRLVSLKKHLPNEWCADFHAVSKMVSNLFEHLFNVYETSLASNDSQISVFSNTVDAPWQGIAGTEPRTAVKAKNHHQTCTSTQCCHWCSAPTPGSRGKIILIKTTNIWLACFQCHPALS